MLESIAFCFFVAIKQGKKTVDLENGDLRLLLLLLSFFIFLIVQKKFINHVGIEQVVLTKLS